MQIQDNYNKMDTAKPNSNLTETPKPTGTPDMSEGLSVNRINVKVSKECIANGKACNANSCPIALALQDAGCLLVWVSPLLSEIQVITGDGTWVHRLVYFDHQITEFMKRFDFQQEVTPFEFELVEVKGGYADKYDCYLRGVYLRELETE